MTHIKISIMFLLVALTFSSVNCLYSQVTIGASEAPHDFSVLELMSDIKGLRMPQLTTDQRNTLSAILISDPSNAPAGLTIYNIETNCLEYWNKQEWISLCDDTTNPALPLPGAGRFTGRTIFDIAVGNDGGACGIKDARKPYSTDFTQTAEQDATDGTVNGSSVTVTNPTGTWLYSGIQVYTFTPSVDVRNVRFDHVKDTSEPDAIINMTPKDPAAYLGDIPAGTACKVVVEYNPNLMTSLLNKTRDQAVKPKLYAFYTDKADNREYAVELTVSLQDCNCCGTAASNSDGWQNFLCYNLGANFMLDPFTPAKGLNGNYYQWGQSGAVADVDDVLTGFPWYTDPRGGWLENSKGPEDPCPSKYRVPTRAQWGEVINTTLNPQTIPPGATWVESLTNFSSGYNYGSVLYLPAAGKKIYSTLPPTTRGSFGDYWTSEIGDAYTSKLYFFKGVSVITGSTPYVTTPKAHAQSVRCIAE